MTLKEFKYLANWLVKSPNNKLIECGSVLVKHWQEINAVYEFGSYKLYKEVNKKVNQPSKVN